MDKYITNTQDQSEDEYEEEDVSQQQSEVPSSQENPEGTLHQKAGAQWKQLSGQRMSK